MAGGAAPRCARSVRSAAHAAERTGRDPTEVPALTGVTVATTQRPPRQGALLALAGIGAAVAVLLGVYGKVHDPTGESTIALFFSGTLNLKAWFTTVAVLLALVQVLTALRLYGKVGIPRTLPRWLGDVHRLSGTLALLFSLPVAYHCLWALGFESDAGAPRRFIHSVAGCFFYGAFVTKVLAVRRRGVPKWALPVLGGATFTALVVLWSTSSLWFFQNVGFPEL